MKELTDSQMEILFLNFLASLSEEEYRQHYRRTEKESGLSDKDIKGLGYSFEEIDGIKEAVEKALN